MSSSTFHEVFSYAPFVNPEDERIPHRSYLTDCPFYGSRRMRVELAQSHETSICRDHVRRLMEEMGIEAVYPRKKKGLSQGDPLHQKYPCLLRGLDIVRPNQVWGSDITYVKLERGFAYLMAILDWFSRYVVAWKVSPTLETDFCIEALTDAFEICNTGYLEYGSRRAVHLVVISRPSSFSTTSKSVWTDGVAVGQHLHGTALADNQV